MKELTKAEELILLTIWRLKEDTYGVSIKKAIEKDAGKVFAYGTLYALLDQLTHKCYVKRIVGEPTPERGGRRKTYYNITETGIESLKESIKSYSRVWDGITELSFDK